MSTPQRYRKKPVTVEAMRLTLHNSDAVAAWSGGTAVTATSKVVIETLEGAMTADLGDYVIRGVQGEFYPCKPDIFEATYEPVEVFR